LERLAREPSLEVAELTLGATARQRAPFQRRDASRIIAAIFEPLERVDELACHRLTAKNADNSAQVRLYPLAATRAQGGYAPLGLSGRQMLVQM
jgi:hypothetical protein